MSRIYVSAATAGQPSLGGLGVTIYHGSVNTLERQQTLGRTTPLIAAADAVAEAVRLTPAGESAVLSCDNAKLITLLTSGGQVRKAELQSGLRQIRDLIHQRDLTIIWTHDLLSARPELARAHALAQDALARAWDTLNSPACPRCGSEMRVRAAGGLSRWVCESENCFQTLNTYTAP